MSVHIPTSAANTSATSAATAAGTWVPCTCACSDATKSKTILVRITPIAIADAKINGFCAHLADPSSGNVWVDLVDSITLLQDRKATFAPRLLIPLDKLAVTLAQTFADAAITNPDCFPANGNSKVKSRNGFPNNNSSSSSNHASSNKMQLDVEWIQQQQEPDQPHALVHLKCTQRTASDQRFAWTFIATQLDPPLAAQILASDLLDPLFRVLHWQILETNHLSFQLDQAKRDLTLARSMLPDPTAVRERTFPPVSLPKDRRGIDYPTVFGNRTRWSQALFITHPAAPSDTASNPSRPPPPPIHAQSQPVFSFTNTLSAAALPPPRAVHSSPTLGPSNAPSSDIGQPPPVARLPPPIQTRAGLPPRTAMLDLLLSSSQPHPLSQSQSQAPTLNSDPYSPPSDLGSLPSTSSASSHRPTSSLFNNLFSSANPSPSALRPLTKSPITLELADSQSQSHLHATEPTPTPPPPMSPRSLLASLPPTLVIPSTVPVPIPAQGPPSSQHTAASGSSAATAVTQFAVPKSPATAARGLKRAREGEGVGEAKAEVADSANANAAGREVAKPKKKKQKLKGLF